MNYTQIEAVIRANVNDTSAVVAQPIDDAINYLSNYFDLKKIDISQSTSIGGKTLNLPTNSKFISSISFDGDVIEKASSVSHFHRLKELEAQRWLEYDGKIQFTAPFTAVVPVEILYHSKFTPLVGVGATICDVPDHLLPLLFIYSTYFYYLKVLSVMAVSRETYPDIDPEELKKYVNEWKIASDDLLKKILDNSPIL